MSPLSPSVGLGAAKEAPLSRSKDARLSGTWGRAEERPKTRAGSLRHLEIDLPASIVHAEGVADHLGEGLQSQGPED